MAKCGERYIFREQEFWAENGLIYIMDYRVQTPDDDRFSAASRAEFAARAIAMNDQARGERYADERYQLCELVTDMCQAVKDAKKQGDPTDSEVAKKKAYENRKLIFVANYNPSRHRSQLLLPNSSYVPVFPPIPQAPFNAPVASDDSAPDKSA